MIMVTQLIACILLAGLLHVEYHHGSKPVRILFFKAPLSFLFLLTAFHEIVIYNRYSTFILLGLFFCFTGDILLAFSNNKFFLSGLIAFGIGHFFYVLAFCGASALSSGTIMIFIVSAGVSFAVYQWLKKGLGNMKLPVSVYLILITLMVTSAGSFFITDSILYKTRILGFSGAALFYISDLFVARQRFKTKTFTNKLFGLPIYYAAQFLIAYSI
jgi:uncharacterized membrane protein YhhN